MLFYSAFSDTFSTAQAIQYSIKQRVTKNHKLEKM